MEILSYKCPNCDGPLTFDPKSGVFTCDYCLSKFSEEDLKKRLKPDESESGAEEAVPEEPESSEEEAALYFCPSCGAEIVTDKTTAATFCFYCHNPVVLKGRLSGEYLPDKMIPFKISRAEAKHKFLKWARGKKFVPKDFFSEEQIEKLSGVYYPYWETDCDVDGSLSAKGTRVRVYMMGQTQYTETSFYNVERSGKIYVGKIKNSALKKADKNLAEGVAPFNRNDEIPFNMAYLSGFLAEKRDIEKADIEKQVENEVHEYAKNILRLQATGYDSLVNVNTNTNIVSEKWEYSLLPVWLITYPAKDKIYYYAINGQTGKACGELPINYGKMALVSFLIFLVCFLVTMGVMYII